MVQFWKHTAYAHLSSCLFIEKSIRETPGMGRYSESHESDGSGGQKEWLDNILETCAAQF